MAKYKDLVGTAIRNNAGNIPTAETGQVFFDSTNVDFKYQFPNTLSSWRTGGNLNTARRAMGGAGADNTEGLSISGDNGSNPVINVESYNGISWTEITDVSTARGFPGSSGKSYTAALIFGGTAPSLSPAFTGRTENWDGSAWTEVADMSTARNGIGVGACGTNTSALAVSGQDSPGILTVNESWNGSTWTEVGDINSGRVGSGVSGADNTSALYFGGSNPPTSSLGNVESWNGSSWTETTDLNTARRYGAGVGTNPSALYIGGYSTTIVANTEEWN